MKLSDWQGRPFLNPLTAESHGEVTGFYVNTAGKVRYLYANGKTFPMKKLYADGEAALCFAQPETPERCVLIHLGAKIYDTRGMMKGIIEDWDTDADTHLSSNGEPIVRMIAGTPDYLIINPEKRILKREKRISETASVPTPKDVATPDPIAPKFTPLPFTQNIRIEERETRASAPLIQEPAAEVKPVDYSFLIGRRVERDVTDLTRTFFIPRGTMITAAIIAQARRAGKIIDLASGSLK